ncbi:autotransporter outer membrane beta-barrel domain-containing protein [Sphingomonas sp. CA1-15]|uniref:Autotransporter outer membrane beta-barrel domain-containing protein n=1 Tax=Sphingomonas immobilis TaxID=3063997 RepID=A0ABT8ZWB3_9SPHN|nr:autotransporter outer membrane beta-barrel domain-containing protein [Sphingomonas sp. CA1-15]
MLALTLVVGPQAFAQEECGPATSATVTCTSAGNPYPNGISYIAPPQDLTINLDSDVVVDTTNTLNIGILAVTTPTNSITINADTGASITTSDAGAFGVLAGTTAGDVTVNTGNVITHGDFAYGVLAVADTGDVIVNSNTITTDGAGADAVNISTGQGNITATGFTIVTNGAGADGFNLLTQGGDINVTLARSIFGGTVITNGDGSIGVSAVAPGAGNVSIVGNGPNGFGPSAVITSGAGSTGVLATAENGNVLVDLSQVQTTGAGSDAIVATSTGGTVTVNASAVTANDGRGIVATGAAGATVTQSGNFIGTGGDNHAAVTVASTSGTARATISTAFTNGANSNAVDVSSATGDAIVSVGGVSTQGAGSTGVRVSGNTASASVASARTFGDNAVGVLATGTGGTAAVVNNGDVTTTGTGSSGIVATGTTGVTISGTGLVSTAGDTATGIDASSTGGIASVTSGPVSTTGSGAVAISARGTSATVTANGLVSRSGAAGAAPTAAIVVQGTTGTATANVGSVTGSGTGISAVQLNGATTAAATVRTGGVVTGNVDGIAITSATGSTVSNAGTINTGTGYAIRATGGAATVSNSGSINGRLLLTGGNDSVTNSGTFNATQASDFGAGNDSFVNSGTYNSSSVTDLGAGNDSFTNSGVFIANAGGGLNFNSGTDSFANSGTIRILPGTATAGTTSFTGLESFANSGTIDLRNGHTGDVFTIGTSAYTGSGASTLGLDVQLGGATPTADRFVTGAATGSTAIVLNNLTTGVPQLNPGIVLVQGGAGSNAGAFTLSGGNVNYGFASYGLRFNAADNSYLLVGAPSEAAFRTLKVAEGARTLWYKSADAWSAHMTSLRDATWRATDGGETPGSGLWLQMYGSSDTRRNGTQGFTTFGQAGTANLGYKQDAFGGQIGFDFGAPKPAGGLVFGITGGYVSSELGFAGSPDRIRYDTINGGAYLSFVSGIVFANALGKYDYSWIDTSFAGTRTKLHGNSYGAQGEVGVRFGGTRFFVEPVAQVAYVKTNIDTLVAPGFSFDFDERDGLRGKAGARVGAAFDLMGSKGLVYASGMAVHEFRGQDGVALTSGGQTVAFFNNRIGTYGQGAVGFNVTTPGGVTGFIEGFGDYSDDYRGGGGRAGIRLHF